MAYRCLNLGKRKDGKLEVGRKNTMGEDDDDDDDDDDDGDDDDDDEDDEVDHDSRRGG